MTRLTEEMVIARSKQSDLATIKKLNCWGSELTDVSIIRRMKGVEVLAFSVNNISSLQYFQDCKKLQELYLRKNNLTDVNELCNLQELPALKYIWLEENPFCEKLGDNYRQTVLRFLPNLKKLDNVEVTAEELEDAARASYRALTPTNEPDQYEDYERYQQTPSPTNHKHHYSGSRRSSSPQKEKSMRKSPERSDDSPRSGKSSPGRMKSSSPLKESITPPSPKYSTSNKDLRMGFQQFDEPNAPSSPKYQSAMKESRGPYQQQQQSQQQQQQQPHQLYEQRSPVSDQESPVTGYRDRAPIPPSISTHSMKEYYQSDRPQYPAQYRHSQTDLTEWDEHHGVPPVHYMSRRSAGPSTGRENGDWDARRTDYYNGFPRRPTHRSSNLLSAALCLIKELDFNSLEVVEHAVRCRINELGTD